LGAIGKHDAAGADFFSIEALHENTLTEWFDTSHISVVGSCWLCLCFW
jgi:hypothetical protein